MLGRLETVDTSGFPRYGNNLREQAKTLEKLGGILDQWDVIAPGHGHPRFYLDGKDKRERKLSELDDALQELKLCL